jgi:hypothetical protein
VTRKPITKILLQDQKIIEEQQLGNPGQEKQFLGLTIPLFRDI